MKVKTMVLLLVACLAGATMYAADLQLGTWKLNEAKSKLSPAAPKNTTVTYETAGDNVKVTVEGTIPDGKTFKSVWTGNTTARTTPSPAIHCLTRARTRR